MANTLTNLKENEARPKKHTLTAVWVVMAALLAGNVFAVWRTAEMQSQSLERNEELLAQIAMLEERANDLTIRTDTNEVRMLSEIRDTRKQAKTAADKAKKSAESSAKLMVKKLAADYRQHQSRYLTDIDGVKTHASATDGQVSAVITDVERVREDVSATRSDLRKTRAELRSVEGDLGLQSGLIATNATELAALRELGEKEYYEFAIQRSDRVYKIGHIGVVLRKTKPKRGKFTLDVIADDRRVEKKDRTVNEPIQFYVPGALTPYEIVVNDVKKDRILGYLAVPKVLRAAAR